MCSCGWAERASICCRHINAVLIFRIWIAFNWWLASPLYAFYCYYYYYSFNGRCSLFVAVDVLDVFTSAIATNEQTKHYAQSQRLKFHVILLSDRLCFSVPYYMGWVCVCACVWGLGLSPFYVAVTSHSRNAYNYSRKSIGAGPAAAAAAAITAECIFNHCWWRHRRVWDAKIAHTWKWRQWRRRRTIPMVPRILPQRSAHENFKHSSSISVRTTAKCECIFLPQLLERRRYCRKSYFIVHFCMAWAWLRAENVCEKFQQHILFFVIPNGLVFGPWIRWIVHRRLLRIVTYCNCRLAPQTLSLTHTHTEEEGETETQKKAK